jgi:signal transduction histidine kinase
VGLVLAFVIVTGILLGAAASLASVRNAAEERRRGLEYAGSAIAASLIPVIADQDPERISAQLQGVVSASAEYEIECIEIRDSADAVIAETEDGCTCEGAPDAADGLFSMFTEPQVVVVPIAVEGLEVASVSIQFQPAGLEQAVYEPVGVTALILAVSMIVVGVWGGWAVLRMVVEPIGELRDAASDIAEGKRDISVRGERADEIGDLAGALEDMTEQLESQERQLLDSYSTLEAAFKEKDELAQRLEYTIAAKSNFVAVASHELRSPLAVIQLYSEMLEDNEFGDLDPQLADAVSAIVLAVERLGAIVSSLLDVALLERGHMPLEYSRVALHDVVEHAVADAQFLATESGVSVTLAHDVPEVFLRGDPVRLRQAVDNLVSNAIKYTANEREVSVWLSVDDEWADTCVSDSGPGIDDDRAAMIFELFGRAETDDNVEVYGLGLGLPISDRIARAHGGCITFEANPEGRSGTTFCLRIPRSGAPSDAPMSFDASTHEVLRDGEGDAPAAGESSGKTLREQGER